MKTLFIALLLFVSTNVCAMVPMWEEDPRLIYYRCIRIEMSVNKIQEYLDKIDDLDEKCLFQKEIDSIKHYLNLTR